MAQIRTSTGKMEDLLSADARTALQQIGSGMDADQPVRVRDGGFVILDPQPTMTPVLENDHEQREGSGRPTAGSRKRTAGRQRTTGGSRKAGAGPRLSGLASTYQQQLDAVREAYPGASYSQDENGLWLSAQSGVLPGIGRKANFYVAIPTLAEVEPRAWAFWQQDNQVQWIGDRHTNFFDGSVCAYSSALDGAWESGDDLRTLLDLYSVWALRHLHLSVYGRWTGRQYALLGPSGLPLPYYRLVEFHDDELCSCGSDKRYLQCCKPQDLGCDFLQAKRQFEVLNNGRGIRDRRPPEAVVQHALGQRPLPTIIEVHEPLRIYATRIASD